MSLAAWGPCPMHLVLPPNAANPLPLGSHPEGSIAYASIVHSPSAHPVAAAPAHVRELSAEEWKSGIAAWLGWCFDGLDMHLYTLVAAPFVAELLRATSTMDPAVGRHASIIQAAFLVGWALGGGFFGRIGDRLGRSRTLCLTVLTYALFTGLHISLKAGGTC